MNIHGPWTAASLKQLLTLKDLDETNAKLIRKVWHTTRNDELETVFPAVKEFGRDWFNPPSFGQKKRWAVDRILRTYGVEHLGTHKRNGRYVDYCNAGDTYAGTILFIGRQLRVGCWGDLVERDLIRETQP